MKKSMHFFLDSSLDRDELKLLVGGEGAYCKSGDCTHSIQQSDGSYKTYSGHCETAWTPWEPSYGNKKNKNFSCFCSATYSVPTSNGNYSRCNN